MKTTITAGLSWIGASDFQDTSDKVYSVTSEGLVQARQVNSGSYGAEKAISYLSSKLCPTKTGKYIPRPSKRFPLVAHVPL
jgi:hypothetical protein